MIVPCRNVEGDLAAALRRLRWVVSGRHYSPQMIADVQEVLRHFGMYPYVAAVGNTGPDWYPPDTFGAPLVEDSEL